jgi:hypothetical protein
MDALSSGITFDDVEPQRFLPDKARAALAAACELVLHGPNDFADALTWLKAGYCEVAMLDRELKESERNCKRHLRDLRHSGDRCDTFPRRLALRTSNSRLVESRRLALLVKFRSVRELEHIAPQFIADLSKHPEKVRDWVVRLTIETASFRGMRLRGSKVVISTDRRADDAVIDATNVEVAWRSMDENCRQSIQYIKGKRRERDAIARKQVTNRGWRLRCAVGNVLEAGLPAGKEERQYARRAVLLACLLSYQHELPLAGEFGSWQWNSEGSMYATLGGGVYVPGRESALFNPTRGHDELLDAGCLNLAGFDEFVDMTGRAVRILRRSNTNVQSHAEKTTSTSEKNMFVEDFCRLCGYMTALITQQVPAEIQTLAKAEQEAGHGVRENWMLWRETRVLAKQCITHLAEIRRTLVDRGTFTTERVDKLDGVQEALSDLIGSISNSQLPGWPMAPQHTARSAESDEKQFDHGQAEDFDRARITITRFTDWLKSASSELEQAYIMPQGGAVLQVVVNSDPEAKALRERTRAKTPTSGVPELRPWTQKDLDNAIRQYKADRAARYADLCEAVKNGKPGAEKQAKKAFGRNAIARALGVKSKAMVSKSPVWVAIAQELVLPMNRNRLAQGTRHTQKPGKVGLEQAVDEKSAKLPERSDNLPAEEPMETAERQETIRRINKLAIAGKTANERTSNQHSADELFGKLQRGEYSDDQVRQIIEMVLNPAASIPTL